MIQATRSTFQYHFGWLWSVIQGHSCMRNQKLCCPFSCKFWYWFGWSSVCFHNLLICWSSHEFFCCCCTNKIKGRELHRHHVMKYTLNIVMCHYTWEWICFKLGMMLNTTKLYSLIPVWMTLMFTQGHMVTGKLELVQSFCFKAIWSNSSVCDGWLCERDDCEEVL